MNSEALTDQLMITPFRGSAVQQSRIPGQRCQDRSPIVQIDNQCVISHSHRCRSGFTLLSRQRIHAIFVTVALDVRRSIGSSQNFAVRASRWDMHVPRFTPVIRVKEKAIPALTENGRHFGNLADDLRDAKPVSSIQPSINYQLPGRRSRRKRGLTLNSQLRKGAWLQRSFTLSAINCFSYSTTSSTCVPRTSTCPLIRSRPRAI